MITRKDVETYEQVRSHLEALNEELAALAKKTPDSPLNRFKTQIVNERLRVANTFLTGIHKPFESFKEFDEAELPTASDVVVVLSQYINSLEGWCSSNVIKVGYNWYWNTEEKDYPATKPTRFRRGRED